VDYYPSERHSHQPKSKLSITEKMIESTAAYRVGKKCNGWINGDTEEYVIKNQQKDSTTDCTSSVSYDDPFHSKYVSCADRIAARIAKNNLCNLLLNLPFFFFIIENQSKI
jgi:hypothetical protein